MNPNDTETTITLNPTALSEARRLYSVMLYLEQQYAATKSSLERLVVTASGADIVNEDWRLDVDSGTLTRTSPSAVQAAPTVD